MNGPNKPRDLIRELNERRNEPAEIRQARDEFALESGRVAGQRYADERLKQMNANKTENNR